MRALQARTSRYGRRLRSLPAPAEPNIGVSDGPLEPHQSRRGRDQQQIRGSMYLVHVPNSILSEFRLHSTCSRCISGLGTRIDHFGPFFTFHEDLQRPTGPSYGTFFAGSTFPLSRLIVEAPWRWIQASGGREIEENSSFGPNVDFRPSTSAPPTRTRLATFADATTPICDNDSKEKICQMAFSSERFSGLHSSKSKKDHHFYVGRRPRRRL
jgi:hypothetical protein